MIHVMQNRVDWLEWRRGGIGGSDAAAVVGLSPYGNPWTVWADKRGLIPLEAEEPRWARAGRLLEPVVIEWFEEDSGLTVVDRQEVVVGEQDWLRATLDGRARHIHIEGVSGVTYAVFQAKTTNGLDGQWTDGAPEHVHLQVQHEMAADGAARAYVAVLLRGSDFLWFQIERDEAVIAALLEVEERFWRVNVLGGAAPTVDGTAKTTAALRAAYPRPQRERVALQPDALPLIASYLRSTAAEAAARREKELAGNRLRALMGDAEIGVLGDKPLVRLPLVQRKGYTVAASEYRRLSVVGGVETDGGE